MISTFYTVVKPLSAGCRTGVRPPAQQANTNHQTQTLKAMEVRRGE